MLILAIRFATIFQPFESVVQPVKNVNSTHWKGADYLLEEWYK